MMPIDRRHALVGTLAAAMGGAAARAQASSPMMIAGRVPDPRETIDLWPGDAPGMPARAPVETVVERSTDPHLPDRALQGITRPRMVVFRPTEPNGAAVLVMPGGGYRWVVIDKEGYEVGQWLSARGFTVFVLFYRLPGDGWAAGADVALSDAQRAIRLIRARADAYGIKPDKVTAMGFSAGGHVCGDLATRFATTTYAPVDATDRLSARPDGAAPIYAVQSMRAPLAHAGSRTLLIGSDAAPTRERAHTPAHNVTRDTPRCFLVHAEDDEIVPVGNTLEMRAALRAAGVPAETHLFAEGGHGFGIRKVASKPARAWLDLFQTWAEAYALGSG